jgi:hypothetical protein
MAYATEDELKAAIFDALETELQHEPLYRDDVLHLKVDDAVRELKRRRCYNNTTMTDEQILADLEEHYTIIKQAALIYYNRMGSEGESVHYENTVHRSFFYDDDIFSGVIPFVKILV